MTDMKRIPTDAEIVRTFLAQETEYADLVDTTRGSESDFQAHNRYRGHMQARSDLAQRLEAAQTERAKAAAAAVERVHEAAAEAVKQFGAFVEAFRKAREQPGGDGDHA